MTRKEREGKRENSQENDKFLCEHKKKSGRKRTEREEEELWAVSKAL